MLLCRTYMHHTPVPAFAQSPVCESLLMQEASAGIAGFF